MHFLRCIHDVRDDSGLILGARTGTEACVLSLLLLNIQGRLVLYLMFRALLSGRTDGTTCSAASADLIVACHVFHVGCFAIQLN